MISMQVLFPLFNCNIKLLDNLPEEIKTGMIDYANQLDEITLLLLMADKNEFDKRYENTFNEFFYCMMSLTKKIMETGRPQQIFSMINEIFSTSQLQTLHRIKNWDEPRRVVIINAIDTIYEYNKIINNMPYILESVYFLAFKAYVNIAICISSLDRIATITDKTVQNNKELLIEKCEKYTEELKSIIKLKLFTNEIEKKIKNSPIYLNKKQLNESIKDIPSQDFNQIIKDLEENNKIMYDKDDTIIWLFADNDRIKNTYKQSTMLR